MKEFAEQILSQVLLIHDGALIIEPLANEQLLNACRGVRLIDLVAALKELGQHSNELGYVPVGDLVPEEIDKLHARRLQHWQVIEPILDAKLWDNELV